MTGGSPGEGRRSGAGSPAAATVIEVTDPGDARLHDYTDLTDVRLRTRREPAEGLFMAESTQVVRRALAAGYRLRSVLLSRRRLPELADVVDRAATQGAPVFVADDPVVEQVAGFRVHRGVLAAVHRPPLRPWHDVVAGARRVAVLEDVVDHTNVGAVARSAAALGVEALLVTPRCADPLYRRSVRVSMGTVLSLPWTRVAPWPAAVAELRAEGLTVLALGASPGATTLDEVAADPPERVCWLLGTEGDGLAVSTMAAADRVVRIPMAGGVDSLNVAAAAAVAFWALRSPGVRAAAGPTP